MDNPVFLNPESFNQTDFEDLIADICKEKYHNARVTPHRYGRSGQKQHGIDILLLDTGTQKIGVQCKRYNPTQFNLSDIINKVENEHLKLDEFIIAITSYRDTKISDDLIELNPPFKTTIWFWEDCLRYMDESEDLCSKYNILSYCHSKSNDITLPNVELPTQINSGSELKKLFFECINKYRIFDFLECDGKAQPFYINLILYADCFLDNLDEIINKCRFSQKDIMSKKSYNSICEFKRKFSVYFSKTACMVDLNPNTASCVLKDCFIYDFKELHAKTIKCLLCILDIIRNKNSIDDMCSECNAINI